MSSHFELFKKEIDESIALIDQDNSFAVQNPLKLPEKSSDSRLALVDTNSLLARCEQVCKKHESRKPTIRIVHQLASVEDTLISKCISAMPNVYLLSDVHPFIGLETEQGEPKYAPTDILTRIKSADIPKQKELAANIFKQSITQIYDHVVKLGGTLVLLEDTNDSIIRQGGAEHHSLLSSLLCEDFNIVSILVVGDPSDIFYNVNRKAEFGHLCFARYCLHYSQYIESFPSEKIFSEDALIKKPQEYLRTICGGLQIPFNNMVEDVVDLAAPPVSKIFDNLTCSEYTSPSVLEQLSRIHEMLCQYDIDLASSKLVQSQFPGVKISPNAPLNIRAYIKKKRKFVIVLAGMRHCGSTALFNILRLLIKKSGFELFSCYSERVAFSELEQVESEIVLIKTHEMRADIRAFANVVITSVRDLRDTVASAKRREFPILKKLGGAVEYADYNRAIYDDWAPISNYEFSYENFMDSPLESIIQVESILGLASDYAAEVCEEVMSLPTDKYEVTLLSSYHITDPDRKESYKTTLSEIECDIIEGRHGDWLSGLGYLP